MFWYRKLMIAKSGCPVLGPGLDTLKNREVGSIELDGIEIQI